MRSSARRLSGEHLRELWRHGDVLRHGCGRGDVHGSGESLIAILMRDERPFYGSPLRIVQGLECIEADCWKDQTAARDYSMWRGARRGPGVPRCWRTAGGFVAQRRY